MKIRIWKLGDHTRNIYPTSETYKKFYEALIKWKEIGRDADLIWDSDIDVQMIELPDESVELVINDIPELVQRVEACINQYWDEKKEL